MHQHQCGQANSWFLKSSSFWLDTPNTHINLYLHTSSLIILMQSDFPNLYPYKQTNIENIIYPLYIVSSVISSLLDIFSLMHSDSFFNPWSRLVHYPTLLVHAKQATIVTNPKSSTHVSFTICQKCLLSHDVMIFHNIDSISLIPFVLLSFAWTRLFFHYLPMQQYTIWPSFQYYVEYHQVCLLIEHIYTSHSTIHKCMQ
jgi:hypothetical protein